MGRRIYYCGLRGSGSAIGPRRKKEGVDKRRRSIFELGSLALGGLIPASFCSRNLIWPPLNVN